MSESTELSPWLTKLEELAKDESKEEESQISMPYISTAGGGFTFQKAELPNPLSVIIVDAIFDNAFYERSYVPGQYQAPVCFAMNKKRIDMQPHEVAPKPQNEGCPDCPKNQFGSTPTGGKACRNYRRLLVLHATDLKDLSDADNKLALLNVSPTSMSVYSKYAFYITNTLRRPVFSVISSIKLAQVAGKAYSGFHFALDGEVGDDESLEALFNLRERNQNLLTLPYPVATEKKEIKDVEDTDKF